MSKETLQERYSRGLLKLGYKEVITKSRKFMTFEHPEQFGERKFVFLGKAGSVRMERLGRSSSSFACSGLTRKIIWDAAGEEE